MFNISNFLVYTVLEVFRFFDVSLRALCNSSRCFLLVTWWLVSWRCLRWPARWCLCFYGVTTDAGLSVCSRGFGGGCSSFSQDCSSRHLVTIAFFHIFFSSLDGLFCTTAPSRGNQYLGGLSGQARIFFLTGLVHRNCDLRISLVVGVVTYIVCLGSILRDWFP